MQPRNDTLIDLALEEDAAFGDITSQSIFAVDHQSQARILAREDMVVCGLDIAQRVFKRVDAALEVALETRDGERVRKGSTVLVVRGPTISLLTAERTALNFLQRLSGIATLARRPFHRYLAAGITLLFSAQALLIMGGITRLLPLTGVTLPLVSYGGSSLLVSSVMIGLLLFLSTKVQNE